MGAFGNRRSKARYRRKGIVSIEAKNHRILVSAKDNTKKYCSRQIAGALAMGQDNLIEQIIKLKELIRDLYFQHFFEHELFSWVWWILIALIIIPLAAWWKLVDKKRLIEISMFGLLINIGATFLDVLGTDYVLWEYPVHVLPMVALLMPVDYVVLPVIQMYIYQKCPKWKKYIIVSVIAAAVQSFIAEPLAIWIGQYKLILWQLVYSLPIYIVIDIIAKFLVERFKKVQAKTNNAQKAP